MMASPKRSRRHGTVTARLVPLALLLVLGCTPRPSVSETRPAPAARPSAETGRAATILVAGSNEQGVFDNARRALARQLPEVSRTPLAITMLSASRRVVASGDALPATLESIDSAFARTAPGASGCLLVATSHGTREGLILTYAEELLTPAGLDAILDRHCADKPTITIISGCFSGIFADPPVPAPNRIILTAAARDRTSFGCSDNETYTYFDGALLELLPRARRWDELYAGLRKAVAVREQGLDVRPSRPQASFGAAIARDELLRPQD